ncbi:acc operon protein [Halosegnis sp.]|uniref:acc operon protein n=1 Tax=Halosegnis sp. TaxID=2864959 RepID=UPI0035D3E0DB
MMDRNIAPPDADEEETAAIIAAVSAYLAEERAETDTEQTETWTGKRWAFAGRSEAVLGRSVRVRDGTPTDAWTAAGRADRL